jgi:DNA-binding FrmR family transcriptional regulator
VQPAGPHRRRPADLRRLRKIEGQVRGLQRMIEADTWCPDVVTQVASATRALQEVAVGLLNDHLRHCVSNAAGKSEADAIRCWPKSRAPSGRSSGSDADGAGHLVRRRTRCKGTWCWPPHLHADHVGGIRAMRVRTFSFSAEPLEPRGIPAYVPAPMRHSRADVAVTAGPTVIAPGMAVLPPLPRMLFWVGSISEQVLVVNVRGFGPVLVSGCGHPPIERILGITERVPDVPIRAVVGGLHLPVHAAGTALMPQAVFGDPQPPWQPSSERDADRVLNEIQARGPRLVALSGHDSTPWTFSAFAGRFGDRYRTLPTGEEITISAAAAG